MKLRVLGSILVLIICGTLTGYIFWQQELRYALPTPIPASYVPVLFKQQIQLPKSQTGPVFLHFFNPECPCSRFNVKHINQLINDYKDQIDFKVVIPSFTSIKDAENFFDDGVEIIQDNEGWSEACGTYSTPQAVIIDQQSTLYFRGNYNRTRYCTDPRTNYAELALQSFVNNRPLPMMDELATRAYGCSFDEIKQWRLWN